MEISEKTTNRIDQYIKPDSYKRKILSWIERDVSTAMNMASVPPESSAIGV